MKYTVLPAHFVSGFFWRKCYFLFFVKISFPVIFGDLWFFRDEPIVSPMSKGIMHGNLRVERVENKNYYDGKENSLHLNNIYKSSRWESLKKRTYAQESAYRRKTREQKQTRKLKTNWWSLAGHVGPHPRDLAPWPSGPGRCGGGDLARIDLWRPMGPLSKKDR